MDKPISMKICILTCVLAVLLFDCTESLTLEQLIQFGEIQYKYMWMKKLNGEGNWSDEEKSFKKDKFKTFYWHTHRKVENETQKRILHLYLHINNLIVSPESNSKVRNIQNEAIEVFEKYYDAFESEARTRCVRTAERDVALQNEWMKVCTEAGPLLKKKLDDLIRAIKDILYENRKFLLEYYMDSMSIWKYIAGYSTFVPVELLKNIWRTELKEPYQKFMSFMRKDYQDLFQNFAGIEKSDQPMPAYIYDMIFNAYTMPQETLSNRRRSGTLSVTRMGSLYKGMADPNRTKAFTNRKFAEEAQKYFKSLGFPHVSKSFWAKSSFIDADENDPINVQLRIDNFKELWIEVNAPVNQKSFRAIHETMFEIHKIKLMMKNNLHFVFWETDYQPMYNAFKEAVISLAMTPIRLMALGFLTTQELDDDDLIIDQLKYVATNNFLSIATAMAVNTWEWDIIAGKISPENRLGELWKRRLEYEGVVPVTHEIPANDTNDILDIYAEYFLMFKKDKVSFHAMVESILKYQIIARLCELARQYNPLNPNKQMLIKCDIRGRTLPGELIRQILGYGSQKNWIDLLGIINGDNSTLLSPKGLLGYLAPLFRNFERDTFLNELCADSKKNIKLN